MGCMCARVKRTSLACFVVFAGLHAFCAGYLSSEAGHATAAAADYSPPDLDSIPDLQTLLLRHQQYQINALSGSGPVTAPSLRVALGDSVGLGNRLPAIATGFVLALFTQRLFLLASTIQQYMDLPFPGNWHVLKHRFQGARQCSVAWEGLADINMTLCEQGELEKLGRPAYVCSYSSIDYDMPLLQINPVLSKYFDKFFPDGEVFHHVMKHLLRPNHILLQELQRFEQDSQQCAIGMHIRTRKHGRVRVTQFISIARMLARGVQGSVFVASDASLFNYVQRCLPERHVWWSDHTATSLQAAAVTEANNPGTELSAVLDVVLLSRCANIIVTPGSSFGAVAAAMGGVRPVYANFGTHSDPFLNPWFLQSVTSEPCHWKANNMHLRTDELATRFRDRHPLYLHHNQCHYQDKLRRVPSYVRERIRTNDTSYIQSLIRR